MPKHTYFGDYQIILNFKTTECYYTNHKEAKMMCIKKKVLLSLFDNFPDVKKAFKDRARQRRIEFRRVIISLSLILYRLNSSTSRSKVSVLIQTRKIRNKPTTVKSKHILTNQTFQSI
jgi:hypothetical protein